MKKSIAYVVLFAFGFLLIPTGLWHDCEHHSYSENSTKKEVKIEKDNCSICDFQLFQIDNPQTFTINFKKPFSKVQCSEIVDLISSKTLKTQLRGPPVLI